MRLVIPRRVGSGFVSGFLVLLLLWSCASPEEEPPPREVGVRQPAEEVAREPAPEPGEPMEPMPGEPMPGEPAEPAEPMEPVLPPPVVRTEPMPQEEPRTQEQEEEFQEILRRQEALRQRQQTLARHYIEIGQRYLDEGRLREAREAFANALKVQPDNAEAQSLYNRVTAIVGEPAPGAPAEPQELWDTMMARRQQAYTLANEHMQRGHDYYTQGEFDRAAEEYRSALIILQAHPTLDAGFNTDQVRAALAAAQQAGENARREAEAARLRETQTIERQREEAERMRIQRRVERLWDQALNAFERERFEEAERISEEIIELQYTHEPAKQLQAAARRARHAKRDAVNIQTYREQWHQAFQELKEIGIPFSGDPVFPDKREWWKIQDRGPLLLSRGETQVSEQDENVRRTLEGIQLLAVDWTDKTLDEAVRFLRANTGVDINILSAANEVAPPDERILNLNLEGISAMSALRLAVSQINGLDFVIEDGQVKITSREQARRRKVTEFYEVRDLTARLGNFPGVEINLNPSGFGAGLGGFEEEEEEGEEIRTIEVDRLMELIRQTVDSASWDEDAENTMVEKAGTLVVRQTPENQRRIAQLLADLRKSTGVQVQIESRFISVENNFLQDIGVDFRGLGDDSGGIGAPGLGTSRPFDDFGLPGTPSVLGTDNSSGVFYDLGGGNGDIRGRTQNLFDLALGNPSVLDSSGGFSLQYTYLDDTQLEAILRAVQKYERVNTVTAPTLLVYNTQRANLQVTNHIAYVKDFDVEIAQAAVIADPIVDVVKEGVVLDVRPIVSSDRRFITLELRPTVATLVRPLRTFSTTLGVGTAVTFEVPELKKESLKTTVVMPDGGTLLLGGLKFYEEQDQVSGIPILKDIPIISFLFSRKGKYTNMRDLIVLLRVKIVIMEELEPSRGSGS